MTGVIILALWLISGFIGARLGFNYFKRKYPNSFSYSTTDYFLDGITIISGPLGLLGVLMFLVINSDKSKL